MLGEVAGKMLSPIKAVTAYVMPELDITQQPCDSQRQMLWDAPREPRQSRAFEFADVMEQGISPGLSSEHVELPVLGKEVRLLVERSSDRKSYVLSNKDSKKPSDEDSALLMAKQDATLCPRGGFAIYVARHGEAPAALGPAFKLEACKGNEKKWVLTSLRCEECEALGKRECGVRELARISHYIESIGDGQAFCMDVAVPHVHESGRTDVWCKVCGDGAGAVADSCAEVLTSRRPKWNLRRKSLTLDFHGRVSMASAKNFQLEVPDVPGKNKLLFGKVGDNQFVLDYMSPLGAVQAFAAALTAAVHWK
jgi:hypothetical protein